MSIEVTNDMSEDDLMTLIRYGDQATFETAAQRLKDMLQAQYTKGYHVGHDTGAHTGFQDGYKVGVDDMVTALSTAATQLKKDNDG